MRDLTEEFTLEQYGLSLKSDQKSKKGIHYLDINIQVEEETIRTTVFRKPTDTPVIIPNWSRDPVNYKKAAFRSMFKRAVE